METGPRGPVFFCTNRLEADAMILAKGTVYDAGTTRPGHAVIAGADGRIAGLAPDSSAGGDIIVPGMTNLHSHAFQRGMAGLAERAGGDFWQWRELMYRFLAVLTPDDVRAIAAQLFAECLRHGYTAIAEFHYLHNAPDGRPYANPAAMADAVIDAAEISGINLTLLPVLYRRGGFGGAPPAEGQRRFLLDLDAYAALLSRLDGRVPLGVAPHSLRAVSPDELRAAIEIAAGRPLHIHIAEQTAEVEASLAWSGARPVRWLLDHAPVGPAWCLVHATHIDSSEIAGIAASGAVVGLCQTTEANLGDGLFPLADFLAADGRFGLGSDSHVSTSPIEELRWADYARRLVTRRRDTAGTALFDRALAGGAQAIAQPAGFTAGAAADLVVLDPDHPALVGRDGAALIDGWIYGGNDSPVRDVMAAGKWVIRDGAHVRGAEIADDFRRTMRALLARL